jgi:hypothetical protein
MKLFFLTKSALAGSCSAPVPLSVSSTNSNWSVLYLLAAALVSLLVLILLTRKA